MHNGELINKQVPSHLPHFACCYRSFSIKTHLFGSFGLFLTQHISSDLLLLYLTLISCGKTCFYIKVNNFEDLEMFSKSTRITSSKLMLGEKEEAPSSFQDAPIRNQ